jgi:hypothetical protein
MMHDRFPTDCAYGFFTDDRLAHCAPGPSRSGRPKKAPACPCPHGHRIEAVLTLCPRLSQSDIFFFTLALIVGWWRTWSSPARE